MTLPAQHDLRCLAQRRDGRAVSIYLPTERRGPETRKSPLLFKNLSRDAVEALEQEDGRDPLNGRVREECERLLDDYDFWQRQSDGLAAFFTEEGSELIQLPITPPAEAYVGRRLFLKPLLRASRTNIPYFLLALSANQCRLFRGDVWSLEPVDVPDAPESLEHALRFDDPEKSLQYHSAGNEGSGQPIYHGQGSSADAEGDRMNRYFRACARALDAYLAQHSPSPLILACVDEHVSRYEAVASYPNIRTDLTVPGSPDDSSTDELHKQARPLVESLVKEDADAVLRRMDELRGGPNIAADLEQIASAAIQGRIDTLVVAGDRRVEGRFDPDSYKIKLRHSESEQGPWEDVLNDLAAETVLHGGAVLVLDAQDAAELRDSGAAAILRY